MAIVSKSLDSTIENCLVIWYSYLLCEFLAITSWEFSLVLNGSKYNQYGLFLDTRILKNTNQDKERVLKSEWISLIPHFLRERKVQVIYGNALLLLMSKKSLRDSEVLPEL